MLIKLLKYELRSTAKTFGAVYLVMLALCSITGAADHLSNTVLDNNDFWSILLIITIMFLFAAVIITTVLNLNRFNKGIFGDEGYLLHTLPVRPWQIIASKLIPAVLWTIATVFVMLCSVALMILFSSTQEFWVMFSELLADLKNIRWPEVTELVQELLQLLSILISFILQIYASRCLAHLFSRHQTGWWVGIWFLLNLIQSQLFNLIFSSGGLINSFLFTVSIRTIAPIPQTIFYLICAVIYWVITQLVLSERLNLE